MIQLVRYLVELEKTELINNQKYNHNEFWMGATFYKTQISHILHIIAFKFDTAIA